MPALGNELTVMVAEPDAELLQAIPLDSCTLTREYINVPGVLVGTVTVTLLPEDVMIDSTEPLFIL